MNEIEKIMKKIREMVWVEGKMEEEGKYKMIEKMKERIKEEKIEVKKEINKIEEKIKKEYYKKMKKNYKNYPTKVVGLL